MVDDEVRRAVDCIYSLAGPLSVTEWSLWAVQCSRGKDVESKGAVHPSVSLGKLWRPCGHKSLEHELITVCLTKWVILYPEHHKVKRQIYNGKI